MKNYKTWSLLIVGLLFVYGAFSFTSLIQAQTVASKITSIVSSTGVAGAVAPGGWVKVRGAGLSSMVSIPGTSCGPLSVRVSDAGQRVDFKIDSREVPGNYQVSVRGSDGKSNTIALKILGATPTVEKSVIPGIQIMEDDPSGEDWRAGTRKRLDLLFYGFDADKVGLSFELCHPSGSLSNAVCASLGSNFSIEGHHGSGQPSVSRELGKQDFNTLYERLENNELTDLYERFFDTNININVYKFRIKICATTRSGTKHHCSFARSYRVIPYQQIGTWSAWSNCDTTTCQPQTRTCLPSGAFCPGESSQPCQLCTSFSPRVTVSSDAEASGGRIGVQATVDWTSRYTSGSCSSDPISGVANWPPPQVAVPGTLRTTIGSSGSQTVNFTTVGTKNFTVTCEIPSGASTVNDTASIIVAATPPTNGGWGPWGACSSGSCSVLGGQTRPCNNPPPTGGGVCLDDAEGGGYRTCYPAHCSDPQIISINGGIGLGSLPAGTTKNLAYEYSNFSPAVNMIQVSICKTTSNGPCRLINTETLPPGSTSGSASTLQALGHPDGRLYGRLTTPTPTPEDLILRTYYDGLASYFRICPYNSTTEQTVGTCRYNYFRVAPNPDAPRAGGWSAWDNLDCDYPTCRDQARTCTNPAPANGGANCSGDSVRPCPALNCRIEGRPTVRNVEIVNLESGTIWRAGLYKDIRWDYTSFNIPRIKTISLSICHKDDTDGTRCLPWSSRVNDPIDNQILSWNGDVVGSGTNNRRIHPDVYDMLVAGRRDSNLSLFDAGGPPFEAKARICPTYSNEPSRGGIVNPSVCAYSSVFSIGQNPNRVEGPGYSLPSGQGCFVGECVCINGQKARCGNPMSSGATCPAMTSCPGVLTITTSDKMLASVSWVFDWFVGLFRK